MKFSIVSLAFLLVCGVALARQPVTKPEEPSGKTAQQASAHQAAGLPAASKARPTRSLSFDERLSQKLFESYLGRCFCLSHTHDSLMLEEAAWPILGFARVGHSPFSLSASLHRAHSQ
jgi:hypothetical protein